MSAVEVEKKRKHKHDDGAKHDKHSKKAKKDKKEKKEKKVKSEKKDKKSKSTIVEVQKDTSSSSIPSSSAFIEVVARLYLHLAPMWTDNIILGVNDQLNALLMKYVPEVEGVILAHSDVKFHTQKAKILYDSPFCHFFINVKFLVWKPQKGSELVGQINLQSEDHIGLLIYGTFNASIPKASIPADSYEWRATEEDNDEDNVDDVLEAPEMRKRNQNGEWINKATGSSIGGEGGHLAFKVEDIIEANDILTVTGSLN